MPTAEVTIQGLPRAFVESLEEARAAAERFAKAEEEIRAQTDKTTKEIESEVKALRRSEAQRRAGLATSERTIAKLVDEERALKGTAAAAAVSEAAQRSLAAKGMDQLRRETANAGRSLSMLFDELKKSEEQTAKVKSVMAGALAPIGAAAAGVAALGAALIANSAAADETNAELQKLGVGLDAVGTAAVNRAAAGLDAARVSGQILGVTIAESVAPGMEELGTRMTALGMFAADTFREFAKGKDTLTIITEIVSKGLVGAFNALVSPVKNAALALALVSDALGITDDAAIDLRNTFDGWTAAMEESTATGLKELVRGGLEPLITATDAYMGKAAELVIRQESANRAMREGKTEAAELAASLLDGALAVDGTFASLDQIQRARREAAAEEEKALAAEVASFAISQRQRQAEAEAAGAAAQQAQIRASMTLAATAADAGVALAHLVAGENSKAAKAAFLVAQGAALAGAIVNTALGVTAALAAPPPATMLQKSINAGIVIAAGVASAATIAATTIGSVGSVGGGASLGGGGSGGGGGLSLPTGGGGGGGAPQSPALPPPREYGIPSSDGFFPASMGARPIQPSVGDEVIVQRGGALNRSNQSTGDPSILLPALKDLLTEMRGMRGDMGRRLHMAAVAGPARAR